jgi:hypothetical protein
MIGEQGGDKLFYMGSTFNLYNFLIYEVNSVKNYKYVGVNNNEFTFFHQNIVKL